MRRRRWYKRNSIFPTPCSHLPDRQGGEGALLRPVHAITDNVVVGGAGRQASHQDVVDHGGQVAAIQSHAAGGWGQVAAIQSRAAGGWGHRCRDTAAGAIKLLVGAGHCNAAASRMASREGLVGATPRKKGRSAPVGVSSGRSVDCTPYPA